MPERLGTTARALRADAPEFVAEAHRQSLAIATSEQEADDQAFVEAISSPWEAEDEDAASR
ncbi:MAG TPA: antitoxin MazE-like protein [Solirubrobacteraceae bacterium]|jgi:hypothetical protein|nr:antitoxin MazE-like protein [Solirubrobacteraceae bacterium]